MADQECRGGHASTQRRRGFLKAVGATGVAGIGGLAGCVGSSPRQDDQVELEFWHTDPQEDRVQLINKLVSNFEDQYDDPVSIDAQGVEETSINEQVLAGGAAGTLPNVLMPNTQMVQQLGSEGLLDTNAVGNAIEQIGRDRFNEGPLTHMSASEGGHFAVPHNAFVSTLWYRQSQFDEHDLDTPNTWETIRESAQTLHDPGSNQFGIGLGTSQEVFTRECFMTFALSNNARVVNADGDVVFNSPEMVEALEFYAELADLNPPGKHAYDELRTLYLSENLHNMMWSTYILDDILEEGGQEMVDDTEIVPTVNRERNVLAGFVKGLTILNAENQNITDREVEVATDFVAWLYSDDAYIPFLHLDPGGFRPVLNDVNEKDQYQEHEVIAAWGDELQEVDEGMNSEGFSQFGIVEGEVISEFGRAAGELLVAEAVVRVIDGEDAETVAEEQAQKIEDAMYS